MVLYSCVGFGNPAGTYNEVGFPIERFTCTILIYRNFYVTDMEWRIYGTVYQKTAYIAVRIMTMPNAPTVRPGVKSKALPPML